MGIMTIAKTTAEERELLRKTGFIHVTGLTAKRGEESYVIGNNLRVTELGRWDWNNGRMVIVTTGGEIWLASTYPNSGAELSEGGVHRLLRARANLIVEKFCQRGKGAFVPCSNGETIEMEDLLVRLVNPDWEPGN